MNSRPFPDTEIGNPYSGFTTITTSAAILTDIVTASVTTVIARKENDLHV
jgi:hypothetical protein